MKGTVPFPNTNTNMTPNIAIAIIAASAIGTLAGVSLLVIQEWHDRYKFLKMKAELNKALAKNSR